jgi:ATP-dependent Lhr-like helicase
LRGDHHLIFANSRARVEELADLLRRLCESHKVPNEFWPHHGNLSKSLREETEAAIRDISRPASAVCTSTLELGIDIGAIKSVAQVGVAPSVASLRQRLGRSGRAGDPAILRVYALERELDERTPPHASLRAEVVQSIATLELLLAGWCEPPDPRGLHLSTLVQQVLSLVAQHGGATAGQAWSALCQSGPFALVSQRLFARFLQALGARRLIQQEAGGELGLAEDGERLVNHYTFYASFSAAEEYRVTAEGRELGSAPFSEALFPGRCVIFGGRRWVVASVDEAAKLVDLRPSYSGKPPPFLEGGGTAVHDRIRREMWRVYTGTDLPRYLDTGARDLLGEGRRNFYRHELHERPLIGDGTRTLWFPWLGDRIMDTIVVWAAAADMEVTREGLALVFEGLDPQSVRVALGGLLATTPPDPLALAMGVSNLEREKFHPWLDRDILAADFAAAVLDVDGAVAALQDLAARVSRS